MLNGIGSSTAGAIGTQRGGDAKRVDVATTRTTTSGEGGVATAVGRMAAEGPPVEVDRVAALRAAIRAGTYAADPQAIAAKMIAGDLS
jgi:negative regulator of flagellin synthesis FlgM